MTRHRSTNEEIKDTSSIANMVPDEDAADDQHSRQWRVTKQNGRSNRHCNAVVRCSAGTISVWHSPMAYSSFTLQRPREKYLMEVNTG